ncbi:MAG TPA: efflux RND transporter periplasmic adaptor subunit [Bryobacteraceae bacterium]|nr:efflux RND transporter periplasmic adaptor subunit [Bryobacteraceae bacterium]
MSAAPHRTTPVLEPAVGPSAAPPHATPPSTGGGRKRTIIVGLLVLIAAAAAYIVLGREQQPAPSQASAPGTPAIITAVGTTGDLTRTLRVSGQTSAIDFSNVTAPILRGPDSNREMILLEAAPAGSWVKKGTRLAQIDAQSMLDHVDDLKDTIETAQSDVQKRKAEQAIEMENLQQSLRLARAEQDKARLEYAASETLTDIQRQLLKLTLDETEARYKQLQSDVAQKQASHAADIRILELTLQRHTRHRDRHLRDVKAFTVYASMDGLVVMQQIWRGNEMGQVQVGDRLAPGQPFMKVVNTSRMQVEGSVNQAESSDFRVGQPARIKLDAFPGLEFDGRVHSIGALAGGGWRNSYYVRTVPIRVAILGNDPRLIPDLSGSADVKLGSASGQVLVPLRAINYENGKPVVYVKTGETFEPRTVTPGLANTTHVAISSGLKAGEAVRLN